MSETNDFDQPEAPPPAGDEGATAAVLPFPLKKTLPPPAPVTDKTPNAPVPVEVKPGEWQAELPDDHPDDEGDAAEGDPVDPSAAVYPPSVADWMSEHDKARRPVLPDWVKLSDQRTAVRKWAVRHYSAMVGYHAVRLSCPTRRGVRGGGRPKPGTGCSTPRVARCGLPRWRRRTRGST